MAYPSTFDSFTNPAGTSLLTSPDHALQHTNINNAVVSIETTIGTTAGTNVLKNFAAGDFPAKINSGGTYTQNIVGGTLTGTLISTGRIQGGTINPVTINTGTFGTPTITGGSYITGTLTNPVLNTGTYGTITGNGDLVLLAQSGSVMQGGYKRQGGTSTDYSVGGTSNFNETGVFMQFGMGTMTGAGTPAAGGTVIFPVAFSEVPLVLITGYGTQAALETVGVLAVGSFTFNSERNLTVGMQWLAIGKR